jgi:actin-like ATPase involved in cell morphogenesis
LSSWSQVAEAILLEGLGCFEKNNNNSIVVGKEHLSGNSVSKLSRIYNLLDLNPSENITPGTLFAEDVKMEARMALKRDQVKQLKAQVKGIRKETYSLREIRIDVEETEERVTSKLDWMSQTLEENLLVGRMEALSLDEAMAEVSYYYVPLFIEI